MQGVPIWATDDPARLRAAISNLKTWQKFYPSARTNKRIRDLEKDLEHLERNKKAAQNSNQTPESPEL